MVHRSKVLSGLLSILSLTIAGAFVQTAYAQSNSSSNSSSQSTSLSTSIKGDAVYELLDQKRHEFKINLLSTTINLHPEIAYDYTINQDLAVGSRLSFSINRDDYDNNALGKFLLSPYFRWHFYKETKGNALRGFFVEANMAYTYNKVVTYEIHQTTDGLDTEFHPVRYEYDEGSAFGLGIGVGYKWITRRAWTFELGGYVGRNLNSSAPFGYYSNYVFSIGKRF
ncbi:MAG: DUF3575 domain-containing protein [Porphyromonas sp.]|nr:DUF3575 domain-containing protein [Porphyromonas sp.]